MLKLLRTVFSFIILSNIKLGHHPYLLQCWMQPDLILQPPWTHPNISFSFLDSGLQHHCWQIFSCEWLRYFPDASHPHGPHHLPHPAACSGLRPAHGHPSETHRARWWAQSWHLLPWERWADRAVLCGRCWQKYSLMWFYWPHSTKAHTAK